MDNIVKLGGAAQSEIFGDTPVAAATEAGLRRQLGRYAEFMVCAELTKAGYFVTHVDAPGFDLILVVGERVWRVQVRSTSAVKGGFCSWPLHTGEYRSVEDRRVNTKRRGRLLRRALDRGDADLVALYHHGLGTTYFAAVEGKEHAIRLPVSQLVRCEMVASLERAIGRLENG